MRIIIAVSLLLAGCVPAGWAQSAKTKTSDPLASVRARLPKPQAASLGYVARGMGKPTPASFVLLPVIYSPASIVMKASVPHKAPQTKPTTTP